MALPSGATVEKFNCVAGYAGATAKVGGKTTGYVLKLENGKWVDVTKSTCGAASAGLDPKILAYCTTS